MAYDYLGLVNDVNRRLNEVELTASNFINATGEYSMIKDAINSAIRYINQHEYEWPFNHVEAEETLTAGVIRYAYPADAKTLNMDSFRIKRSNSTTATATVNGATTSSTSLNVDNNSGAITSGMTVSGSGVSSGVTVSSLSSQTNLTLSSAQTLSDNTTLTFTGGFNNDTKRLRLISYEEYLDKYVDYEYNTNTSIRKLPEYVFRTPNQEFGLVAPPDNSYELVYEYYRLPVDLINPTDVPSVPEQFRYMITNGAMHFAYMFRGEGQEAAMIQQRFDDEIKQLRSLYINRYDYLRSTVINQTNSSYNTIRVS